MSSAISLCMERRSRSFCTQYSTGQGSIRSTSTIQWASTRPRRLSGPSSALAHGCLSSAPDVYVIANYKETQLTRVKPGQPVDVTVDSFPNETLHGRVERIAPASGSQFALLPPDNATGHFTKVVQRIPVRIALDKGQPLLERLLPGMSVETRIHTDEAGADGGK